MLINQEKVKVEGNIPFAKKVEMTLDPSAVAMHIRNMIRMYENPRLAALREYTSNARDAHQAAGYKGPVEVTLPTSLHPFLTIKDYGVGLDSEEIEGFGQFGRSTKNNSNEYIGGFGLGSKSGLAVAQQFTVIAVKNGKKNVVIVGRDEENHPTLGFTAEQDTNEPNGVTIQIPSSTHFEDWRNIAEGKMFLGWEPGSIVINGKEPTLSVHNTDQYKRLAGGWLTMREREGNRYYYGGGSVDVLVHGVYYSVPAERFRDRRHAVILRDSVLEIENGAVDILPSRDNLEWTDRTAKAINDAAATLTEQIVAEYQKQIAKVKTFREAKRIQSDMDSIGLPVDNLEWKGIPLDWRRGKDVAVTVGTAKASTTAKSGFQTDRSASSFRTMSDVWRGHTVLVTGASGQAVSSYYKKSQKFHTASGETTAFIVGEATRLSGQVRDVTVYFTESTNPKDDLHPGFVAAMARVIDEATFITEAKAQRAVWAKNRSVSGTPRPVSTDRIVRVLWGYDSYGGRTTTVDSKEGDVIAEQATIPVVVAHADNEFAAKFLEAHVEGNASAGMKSLMRHMANQAQARQVRFVLLARNQKASNLAITGWTELDDWVRAEFAKVKVRTPMQMQAEAIKRSQDYFRRLPDLGDTFIAKIEDATMREFYEAFMHPFVEGELGEAAKAFPEFALTQPKPSEFNPFKSYPILGLVAGRSDVTTQQSIVDYINLVDSAR